MLIVLFHDISQNLHKDNSLLFPNQTSIDLIDFHLFKYKLKLIQNFTCFEITVFILWQF